MKTGRKIMKFQKQFKKIALLTGIYAIFAAIISFSIIAFIDNSTTTGTDEISNTSNTSVSNNKMVQNSINSNSQSQDTKYIIENKLTNIPYGAINISFSYDGKYCAYLYRNEIYIKDISSDTLINKISDNATVAAFRLISDRDIIIYFTLKGTSLNVKSYDIANNMETLQKTINIPAGATIKHIDYSALTNLIFFNIESGDSSKLANTLYYLNIMKRVKTINLKNAINNMVLLNNTFTLYYEDSNNNLFCYPQPIVDFNKQKVQLLGCDSGDNVFIESLDNKNTIYIVKNEKIDKTINLNDHAYIEIYTNKIGVYVVYSNYIINLAGDINKKMLLDKNLKFIGIGGPKIYFRDSISNIISRDNPI